MVSRAVPKPVDFATLGESNEISPFRVSAFGLKAECTSSSWDTGIPRRGCACALPRCCRKSQISVSIREASAVTP
jgi:hypothetical protein